MSTDPGMRLVAWAWLGWIVNHLDELAHEIRAQLGREPDPGDLLIILASAPDMVLSRALEQLGVVADQLAGVAEEVRRRPNEREFFAATEHVRQQRFQYQPRDAGTTTDRVHAPKRCRSITLTSSRAARSSLQRK
jgi:hypothetical protein